MKKIFYFFWPVLALIVSFYVMFISSWGVGTIIDMYTRGYMDSFTEIIREVPNLIVMLIFTFMSATYTIPTFFLIWPEIILHIFLEYPVYACLTYSLLILSYIWWFKQPRWLSGIAVLVMSVFAGPAIVMLFNLLGFGIDIQV